jgi:RHS repeat-associated protein
VILNRQEYHYDSIGRLWQERRQVPNAGWIRRQVHYLNALGWKSAESTWFSLSEYPAGWTRYHDYDAYGRAWAIQAPDAQTSSDFHMTRFSYGGERYAQRRSYVATHLKTDDTVGETKYIYETFRDGQGRIWRIQEPDGGLTATYDYDAAGNLTHARLDSGSGVVQHRYWTYDGRGFMTREIHPENGTYHFESIDARGKALRQRHDSGLRDLAFEYDAAERMTGVRDRKLSGWPYLKSFEYAGSGDAGAWGFGKLWKATRTNIRRLPWAPSITAELDVTETYTYSGVGGRISRRVTDLNNSDRVFDQSWTYDDLGNVKTQSYPRCTDAPCNAQPGPARTLTRDYVYGQLTAVREGSTTLGSLTYHDDGSLASVLHANQIQDEIDQDPWNRALPRNFRTVFQDGSSVELGVHHYDGSGNLKERRKTIGGCTVGAVCQDYYLYDGMNRLRHFHDGSGAFEAYGYDAFGNMTWVDWTDTGLSPLRRNLPVISSSNRSGMGSYDAVGNLTSRLMGSGSEIYEFDALDMIASRNFPEETFVYTADDERIHILRWQAGQPTDEEYTLRDLDGKVLTIYDLEVDSAEHWSWRKDFVYRGSALLMSMADQPWPTHRQHFSLDHLGSPRLVTAHNGTPLEDHHYLGFGRELGAFAGNENLEQRFTGHRRDHNAPGEADDLDYMHARYYSPWLNRFLSVDPVLGEVESPQSWNRYAYVRNNPLKYTDPSGEAAVLKTPGGIGSPTHPAFAVPRQPTRTEVLRDAVIRNTPILAQALFETFTGVELDVAAAPANQDELRTSVLVGNLNVASNASFVMAPGASGVTRTVLASERSLAANILTGTANRSTSLTVVNAGSSGARRMIQGQALSGGGTASFVSAGDAAFLQTISNAPRVSISLSGTNGAAAAGNVASSLATEELTARMDP